MSTLFPMNKFAGFDNDKEFYFIFQDKSDFNTSFCSLVSEMITTVQYAWKILPSQMLKP